MFEEDDLDVVGRLGAPVEVFDQGANARHGGRVATQDDGVRAFDGGHGHHALPGLPARRGENRLKNSRDLTGGGVFQRQDVEAGAVHVDARDQGADTGQVVGEVRDHHAVAGGIGQDLALRSHQRPNGFRRRGRIDVAKLEDFGREPFGPDGRRPLGRTGRGTDAIGARPRRRHDQTVGAQGRQKHLEQLGTAKGSVAGHRDGPGHRRIDDEGAPGHTGDILNEGADVGALDVQGLPPGGLGHGRRRRQRTLRQQDRRKNAGKEGGTASVHRVVLMVVVCTCPARSKRTSALALLASWPRRAAIRSRPVSSLPLTDKITSPA